MLEKKKVNTVSYDHFIDGKENILHTILEELNKELEAIEEAKIKKDEEKDDPKPKMELFPKDEEKTERKPRKEKKTSN